MIHIIPIFDDNYVYQFNIDGFEFAVDPGEAEPLIEHLKKNKIDKLDYIIVTHHHHDHIGGVEQLKKLYSSTVIGPDMYLEKIIDEPSMTSPSLVKFNITPYKTPGHTLDHIIYQCDPLESLFVGDTLFAMGCGRLFEGTAEQLFNSLEFIKTLPQHLNVYCTHEYTLHNLNFSLSVAPNDLIIQNRLKRDQKRFDQAHCTLPFRLEEELESNLFLRTQQKTIQQLLKTQTSLECFTQLRLLRDKH